MPQQYFTLRGCKAQLSTSLLCHPNPSLHSHTEPCSRTLNLTTCQMNKHRLHGFHIMVTEFPQCKRNRNREKLKFYTSVSSTTASLQVGRLSDRSEKFCWLKCRNAETLLEREGIYPTSSSDLTLIRKPFEWEVTPTCIPPLPYVIRGSTAIVHQPNNAPVCSVQWFRRHSWEWISEHWNSLTTSFTPTRFCDLRSLVITFQSQDQPTYQKYAQIVVVRRIRRNGLASIRRNNWHQIHLESCVVSLIMCRAQRLQSNRKLSTLGTRTECHLRLN